MKKLSFLLMSIVMVFSVISCEKNEESSPDLESLLKMASAEGIQFDVWKAGSAEEECLAAGCNGDFSVKIEAVDEGIANDVYLVEGGNTITISNSTETLFDWESDYPVCAVIVKGGRGAVVYDLIDPVTGIGATSGTGFLAPTNLKKDDGTTYGVSHVTFCYNMPSVDNIIAGKFLYTRTLSDGSSYDDWAITAGVTVFDSNRWCGLMGVNLFPDVSKIDILRTTGQVIGEVLIGTAEIKVNFLYNDYTLNSAHLYIGSQEDLVAQGICPDYQNPPWIVSTNGIIPLN